MIRTSTPAELQAAIACTLRRKLRLDTFKGLQPEDKRLNLESAKSFLCNGDSLLTDKRAVITLLEVIATDAEESERAIALNIVKNWNNTL